MKAYTLARKKPDRPTMRPDYLTTTGQWVKWGSKEPLKQMNMATAQAALRTVDITQPDAAKYHYWLRVSYIDNVAQSGK